MTFEQFLELVPVFVYKDDTVFSNEYEVGKGNVYPIKDSYSKIKLINKDNPGLYFSAHSGGYSSGGWREGSESTYQSIKYTINYTALDDLLEKVAPNITYLQYKQIQNIIEEDEYTESEYYGNTSDYVIAFIPLKGLYELLKKWKYI